MTSSGGFKARPRGRAQALAELKQKNGEREQLVLFKNTPGGVKPNMS